MSFQPTVLYFSPDRTQTHTKARLKPTKELRLDSNDKQKLAAKRDIYKVTHTLTQRYRRKKKTKKKNKQKIRKTKQEKNRTLGFWRNKKRQKKNRHDFST